MQECEISSIGLRAYRPICRLVFLVVLGLSAFSGSLLAQNGTIEGVVKDPSGAVVRGAQVSCVDELGQDLRAETDASGRFRFSVSAGQAYQVVVSQSGFASGTVPVKALKSGQTKSLM